MGIRENMVKGHGSKPPPTMERPNVTPGGRVLDAPFTFDPRRCNHLLSWVDGGVCYSRTVAEIDCPHCLRRKLCDCEKALRAIRELVELTTQINSILDSYWKGSK